MPMETFEKKGDVPFAVWMKIRTVRVALPRLPEPPPRAENLARCVQATHGSGDEAGGRRPPRGS